MTLNVLVHEDPKPYTHHDQLFKQLLNTFLRMLVKMKLDPAKTELINGFFETYLTLNKSEGRRELMDEIKQLDQQR